MYDEKECVPQAPLFRDPIYDGAADPTIIWNQEEQAWWLFYTSRRAAAISHGVSYCHGTDIGIASSEDGGRTWTYRGIAEGLHFEKGRNTYWAPEVLFAEGSYHMYVSYVRGVPHDWNHKRNILHYTSYNLWDWQFESKLNLSSDRVIDACVQQIGTKKWKMWYKDEMDEAHTYAAESTDLYQWQVIGPEITDCQHEGPNVFEFKGYKWMITDSWCGMSVYRSDDYKNWHKNGVILREPGERQDDHAIGNHADILVCGERAYIFYFTHPELTDEIRFDVHAKYEYAHKRSSIQVAELEVREGLLVCDRDKPFQMVLKTTGV